jgi:hypothetical protein
MTFRAILLLLICVSAASADKTLPPASEKQVTFSRDILPILAHRCFECHAGTKKKGSLQLDTKEKVLKGGQGGPAAVLGKSANSSMIKRVAGLVEDPEEIMPPKEPRLTKEEIGLLRAWIDQGMNWDKNVVEKGKEVPVTLRPVTLSEGPGHPIDRLLAYYFANHKVPALRKVDDATYARRVYLDIIGLLPTAPQLDTFLKDPAPDKRAALAKTLLANNAAYADHWITFWQDLLRDGKKDLGSTDIFRPITPWLREALETNRPYNEFVAELVDPLGLDDALKNHEAELKKSTNDDHGSAKTFHDATGFVIGLQAGLEIPRGDQQWPVQAVQNISQVFLGVQLKCATCHDSFIDRWEMKDAWGLASIYSDKPLEMVRCELPTGKTAAARFLFPEVGQVDPAAPPAARRKQLASLITSPKNGRFARTAVNRIWSRLLGRGLVEPVDEMDKEAFAPDVMEWLAADFIAAKYDLKMLIEKIVTSDAYQYASVDDANYASAGYVFRGPLVRRLSAEQFVDAVYSLTGRAHRVWQDNGGRLLETLGRPDRRTVVTQRDARSSTLQAMELLNGGDLHAALYGKTPESHKLTPKQMEKDKLGGKDVPQDKKLPPITAAPLAGLQGDALVNTLFLHALARKPTDKEKQVCTELLSAPGSPDAPAQADVLWLVVMLPEFQLIR